MTSFLRVDLQMAAIGKRRTMILFVKSFFFLNKVLKMVGDTKQSRLESTTEITQNKHVKVLHYFVDDIK